ncbi:hypothetical protein GGX14DRAFT_304895, partial [Mycena pura]
LERHVLLSMNRNDVTVSPAAQIYYAVLVFLTQKLSMRRCLQTHQTLTATHDNATAWSGIASALFRVWDQKVVPASMI